jgi:hypothetical protein
MILSTKNSKNLSLFTGIFILTLCTAIVTEVGGATLDPPIVSSRYNGQMGQPKGIIGNLPAGIKRVWVTAWLHDAPPKSRVDVTIDYFYKGRYANVFHRTVEASGTLPVFAEANMQGDALPTGKYRTTFTLNGRESKSTIFGIGEKYPTDTGCQDENGSRDQAIFDRVIRRYPEVEPLLKGLELFRVRSARYRMSVMIPGNWKPRKRSREIIALKNPKNPAQTFTLDPMGPEMYQKVGTDDPVRLMRYMIEGFIHVLKEEAREKGGKILQLDKPVILQKGERYYAHIVFFHKGNETSSNRWRSVTLFWDGRKLFYLMIIVDPDNLHLAEFLSRLALESFCSR